jgi:hypothetical protein
VEQFFEQLRSLLLPSIMPRPQVSRTKVDLPIGRALKLAALRNTMDLCLDKLPNLLKIDTDDAVPIHKLMPRVLSQLRALSQYSDTSSIGTTESDKLSESMGYVLQKVNMPVILCLAYIREPRVKYDMYTCLTV